MLYNNYYYTTFTAFPFKPPFTLKFREGDDSHILAEITETNLGVAWAYLDP